MAHNNQNHTKRASFILAVAVNLYAVIATYLYKNFQINLMDYATPIILWTVGIILTCAIVQRYLRFFCLHRHRFFFWQANHFKLGYPRTANRKVRY